MKKIYIPLLAVAVALPSMTLTGCIEETFPTSSVTQDQVVDSPNAATSFALGMPAFMNSVFVLGDNSLHYDFGYPAMMHIRDVMTGDMPIAASASGYDWFTSWELNEYQAESNIYPQVIWNYYTQQVQTANLTIAAVDPETTVPQNKYYLGAGLAFRAMAYLDMARMFEYLPTDGTSAVNQYGNDVTNLTVPIVTETMGEAEARQNPRATREQMIEFIISDLDKAETYIVEGSRPSKTMPDLACVYGLKARAYMWVENYPKAKEYAEKAIAAHKGTPTTEAQWLSTTNGFNDLDTPSWMWGMKFVKEDNCVRIGIVNWTSWASNELKPGYSAAEPHLMIDAALYNSIDNRDFRKLTFVAPEGSPLEGKENFINRSVLETPQDSKDYPVILEPYASLKFKPAKGEMLLTQEGCSSAAPMMRVEEMYFIKAEAAAQTSPAEGKAAIEDFMRQYRFAEYACSATTKDGVVDEIFRQKRMEFYGEGIILFDYKRLNKPVVRHYDGSNWVEDKQFNTTTRPAWMNYVIVQTEGNNNSAVKSFNNPNPSGCYTSLGTSK